MAPSLSHSEPTPAQGTSAVSFGALAKSISAWTTNLLATAIVLAGGLALGWQVLAWWHEAPQMATANPELAAANLPLVDDSREFWTSHGPLKIERVRGSEADAVAGMWSYQKATIAGSEAAATLGPGEKRFLAALQGQTPLEESGDLTLYQPRGQTAMVVAVSRPQQRIVGWSFALESEHELWTLYHFRPTPSDYPTPPTIVPPESTP